MHPYFVQAHFLWFLLSLSIQLLYYCLSNHSLGYSRQYHYAHYSTMTATPLTSFLVLCQFVYPNYMHLQQESSRLGHTCSHVKSKDISLRRMCSVIYDSMADTLRTLPPAAPHTDYPERSLATCFLACVAFFLSMTLIKRFHTANWMPFPSTLSFSGCHWQQLLAQDNGLKKKKNWHIYFLIVCVLLTRFNPLTRSNLFP